MGLVEIHLSVEFGKSRSKYFKDAVTIIKILPNYKYDELEEKYMFEIDEFIDYVKYIEVIDELIELVSNWKSTSITIDENENCLNNDYYDFKNNIIQKSGKYRVILESSSFCGMDSVLFEDLPLPVVYYPSLYGAFFGFARDVGDQIYFCECNRQAIENYIELRTLKPLLNYSNLRIAPLGTDCFSEHIAVISQENPVNPLSLFKFEKDICFRCNDKVPKLDYCHSMYGTAFDQKYGWYIKQKYFELGIDAQQYDKMNVLMDYCPPEIYDEIYEYSKLVYKNRDNDVNQDLIDRFGRYRKNIGDKIENLTRDELGIARIGEYWTSEVILFNIVEGLLPEYKSIRHHRPKWLEGLELDLYIPELKLGFEYQGIQHFEPVEHWGGIDQLRKQQKNDKRKKELCNKNNVDLILVNYDEKLSSENIKRKILNIVDGDLLR